MTIIVLLAATPTFAGTQALFETDVAPDFQANWVVVDDFPSKETEAREALKKTALHAREILDRLDPLNPSGETALFLSKKEKGTYPVSPDLAKILRTTQEVARRIGEPLAGKIKVDLKKNQVQLKATDVTINIEPVLKGYLADVMMADLVSAGFENSFLELGGVFVAKGEDFNGPWKIEVSDPATEYARHSFFYKVSDTGAATIADEQRTAGVPASDIKSVTVFTKEGASKAQGLASAAYAMGLARAEKFLKGEEVERAVLIDTSGKFHQFPEIRK